MAHSAEQLEVELITFDGGERMSSADDHAITEILHAAAGGDREAPARLLPLLYDELQRLARSRLRRGKPQTLQTNDLVHEAYLRVMGRGAPEYADRKHFFFAAAKAMRHILVDRAREKQSLKRGGDRTKLDLDPLEIAIEAPTEDILDLNRALSKLAAESPDRADVVLLRYFAGLSLEETADVLGISVSSVTRRWRYARAWLRGELEPGSPSEEN